METFQVNEIVFQISTLSILLSAMAISIYYRRKADKQSGETLPRSVDGVVMMGLIRLGGIMLWVSPVLYIVYPSWLAWSQFGLPDWFRVVSIGLGALCVVGVYWLFRSIDTNISATSMTRQEHALITYGPYRWVRHPLYSIGLSVFVSIGMIADSWLIMALAILAFSLMAIRTPQEEANLIEKFGDSYKQYMKQTGRFFPKLR